MKEKEMCTVFVNAQHVEEMGRHKMVERMRYRHGLSQSKVYCLDQQMREAKMRSRLMVGGVGVVEPNLGQHPRVLVIMWEEYLDEEQTTSSSLNDLDQTSKFFMFMFMKLNGYRRLTLMIV